MRSWDARDIGERIAKTPKSMNSMNPETKRDVIVLIASLDDIA